MMIKKEFIESQEECASMLGMTLDEYLDYCKNVKVPTDGNKHNNKYLGKTEEFLNYLGLSTDILKKKI